MNTVTCMPTVTCPDVTQIHIRQNGNDWAIILILGFKVDKASLKFWDWLAGGWLGALGKIAVSACQGRESDYYCADFSSVLPGNKWFNAVHDMSRCISMSSNSLLSDLDKLSCSECTKCASVTMVMALPGQSVWVDFLTDGNAQCTIRGVGPERLLSRSTDRI